MLVTEQAPPRYQRQCHNKQQLPKQVEAQQQQKLGLSSRAAPLPGSGFENQADLLNSVIKKSAGADLKKEQQRKPVN